MTIAQANLLSEEGEKSSPEEQKKSILSLYDFSREASYGINPRGWGTGRQELHKHRNELAARHVQYGAKYTNTS